VRTLKTQLSGPLAGLLLAIGSLGLAQEKAPPKSAWWPADVDRALARAGANRAELSKALTAVPAEQRKGLVFLIANMPESDLRSLRADFLLENVALAYQARARVPWGKRLPEALFLNDVLPYANVDEARHPWRKELYELCLPLVKDCKTPGEAAHRLNSELFKKLQVRYSTQRKKPHQSPKETIETKMASCTGLSILLADACRSVAVPARLVGTPLWTNKRGNHTWVEVWDNGWHFTGACEADPKGLDRGWFVGEASKAIKDSRVHAIYAASFKKTAVTFPLLWAPQRQDVFAENVTDRYAKPSKPAATAEQLQQAEKAARAYFAADAAERGRWKFDVALDHLLANDAAAVRRAVWKAYQAAPIHAEAKKDFEQNQVRHQKYLSAYVVRKVGKRPLQGWPLFIAMHGGGRTPKSVNDSQWKVMQRYYRDQPSVTGYQYLALRAPNDTWNGFYDDYVPPLIINLIRQFLLFGDIDPDKVFLMGYSHGGYGAFFIGPKIPDRFAAVHASAAAPTDGTISARTLRNTRFTFMVGEKDNAYGRRERCETFAAEVRKLQEQNKGAFPVVFELKKGFGHTGLPDRDKIKEMYPFTRQPTPRRLTWDLTDPVIAYFFWLAVPRPGKEQSIDAALNDNNARISTRNVKQFELCLDERLVAFGGPLRLTIDGNMRVLEVRPSFRTLCESLAERGDPELAFTCRVRLEGSQPAQAAPK
jgi:transglutaminase-like putative cysteine protease/predicted esterase